MAYILAHDIGTSGNKATLFREDGLPIKEATIGYPTKYFMDVSVEQDADQWWNAVKAGTKIVTEGIRSSEIAVLSFSGHMMGSLCVDKRGTPLRPSIIWADQRAQDEFAVLRSHISDDRIYGLTGHRGSASYSLPKLMWVKKHEPEIYDRTYKTLNCKEYILYKLTGCFYTEPNDGVGTLAMDITKKTWSSEMLEAAGIEQGKFPDVIGSSQVAGKVSKEAARETGLQEGLPVIIGGGDAAMGAVGTGVISAGDTFVSLGSSSWVSSASETPLFDSERRTTNWPHAVDGLYLNDGVMQCGGASYSWLKDVIGTAEAEEAKALGVSVYQLIDKCAAQSPAGANGIVFLPYLLGERSPRWNAEANGAFIGLKMENCRADIFRSVLEGVTYNLANILEIFRLNGMQITDVLVTGGGAQSRMWRQMIADAMDVTVHCTDLFEGGASLGAAITGAVGIGIYPDFASAVKRFVTVRGKQEPEADATKVYDHMRKAFNVCYEALTPAFPLLSTTRTWAEE